MVKVVLKILSLCVRLLLIVLVIAALFSFGRQSYDFGYRVYTEPAVDDVNGRSFVVNIDSGTTLKELAETLETSGMVNDKNLFYVQAKLMGFNLSPGKYKVNSTMDINELIKAMTPEASKE